MCGLFAYHGKKTDLENFDELFSTLYHRGPDRSRILELENATLGFHRLAIMGLTPDGDQPFEHGPWAIMCNGEIYNYEHIKTLFRDWDFKSTSDCEVLLPLLTTMPLSQVVELLDGEYAFVAYHRELDQFIAARDPMGIRPLFWGRDQEGKVAFSSEAKALHPFCEEVTPFPPGHYFDGRQLHTFCELGAIGPMPGRLEDYWDIKTMAPKAKMQELLTPVRELLIEATKKRLHSDAPLGALLSGGLDSSLVCSIAMKELKGKKPLRTFAVGMDKDPIDLRYAREVADFIGSDHTEIIITEKDLEEALHKVIWHLETWDITTIRASMGMYLLCEKIRQTTDIKVLLTGEVSDELFGYKYTDFAPSGAEFQKEAQKRVRELYVYDVLRADRCIAGASLEARVPFSDTAFVQYVMSMPAELKRNHYDMGKYLLREAFREGDYLPSRLLNREKAAFSDAVGHSLVDFLKARAQKLYTDQDLLKARERFAHGTPFTLESLMYREIFEQYYAGRGGLIPSFWMPNKSWENCNVDDPSARVLPNYGLSGV
jgi:asparagine synthase (glutamine-hydrolysing)